jgi:predicted permease
MTGLLQDIRYAARQVRKSPGFTTIAVVTIAIGIAANVSVFSFMDALFLRSVPAKDPSRLVRIVAPAHDGGGLFSYPEYAYLRDHLTTLGLLSAHYSTAPLYITANGETGEVQGAVVSSSYFEVLGLRPQLGRLFTMEEDSVPDRDAVAILGYGFWQRVFGGDPKISGKTLIINGHSFDIIGVMPQGFNGVEIGGMPNEIWIPTMMMKVGYRGCDGFQPSCTFLGLIGRMAPGTKISQAQAEVGTLMRQLHATANDFDERLGVSVTPAIGISDRNYFGDRNYFVLLTRLLTTIGGILLLILCANLGGLLIARANARSAELAMRQALGARRPRIIRQLLTESLLLAGAGGVSGVVISLWTSRLLVGFYSVDSEGYRHLFDIRPNVSVLAYSVIVALLAGILFGLLPAWQASRTDLNQVLKSRGNTAGSDRNRSRTMLVIMQVALSLALLVGAGLLMRSTVQLEAGTNMDLHHVLGLRLRPELLQYSPDKARVFKQEVVRRLRELPGVESVSLAKGQGLIWHANLKIRIAQQGKTYSKPADQPEIFYKPIAPDYFATLGIPFIAGRDFNDHDRPGSLPVAVVNETLAGKVSSGSLPLFQTVLLDDKPYQIVGVVKDAQVHSVIETAVPVVYLPFWQDETLVDARMCVRVSGAPSLALPMIRKAIASIDSSVPVTEAMPLIDQVRGEYTDARVASAVVTSAAAIGLLLSAIGLYGVIAYEVGRRTREIGIRMALGAQPQQVLQLFFRQGLVVIFIGTAAGGVLALTTTRLLAAWLFGVGPFDFATFSLAVAILLALVLFASYIPARHATKVDPMVALRYE